MTARSSIFLFTTFLLLAQGCSSTEPYLLSTDVDTPAEHQRWLEERLAYVRSHPQLARNKRELVEAGVLDVGLTKEEFLVISGGTKPDRIITSKLKYDADELWFYRGTHWNGYCYFKNDVLVKIDQGGSLESEGYR